jgi:hypothetical protein
MHNKLYQNILKHFENKKKLPLQNIQSLIAVHESASFKMEALLEDYKELLN